jgi:hypothetical protein
MRKASRESGTGEKRDCFMEAHLQRAVPSLIPWRLFAHELKTVLMFFYIIFTIHIL